MAAGDAGRSGAVRAPARGRVPVGLTLLLAGATALAGCTTAPPEQRGGYGTGDDQVEVFSWWASGSEKRGLDALVAVFADQHPRTTFVDGAIPGGAGSAAKDLLDSRLHNEDPPDTFQVHGGAELAEHVDAGHLEDLDELWADLGLRDVVPPVVQDLLTVDGSVYAVPSNIHRANMLWADPAALEEAGLEPTVSFATLDEWFVALEAVAQTDRTPLALASTWTQVHLLEQVLLSRLGPAGYTGLWDGTTDPTSTEVTAALADFSRLLAYSNDDRDRLDWQDAAQQVADGDAAFTVMGDWALVAFQEAGGIDSSEVLWAPVPGTADTFNVLVDAFTLPVGAPHPESARQWLTTVASTQGQAALSTAKGSIPARTDVDRTQLGSYQNDTLASFRTDTLVPSLTHGTAASTDVFDAVSAAVGRFSAGTTNLTELQAEIRTALD
ncbi:MAG: carbohydrate transporter substrate-binding protein [Actinotalea sp.]|nr:carbohydrate transporter substrate-binding protein [Actinotalea sp.]